MAKLHDPAALLNESAVQFSAHADAIIAEAMEVLGGLKLQEE